MFYVCVDDESSAVNANPFPEPEIDDIRVLKDAELLRYVQVNTCNKYVLASTA